MSGRWATVFAPATVANVAVGFDVLGFAFDDLGDLVTVELDPGAAAPVVIETVRWTVPEQEPVPLDPQRNTAGRALLALLEDLGGSAAGLRFRVRIEKGIPLGSGLGGSASSAVGAVVAAAELLAEPLPRAALLRYALAGEAAASGAPHGDNVTPCLFGGLCGFVPGAEPLAIELPVPSTVRCVLVRPRLRQDTITQRGLLAEAVPLADFAAQSAHLAAFVTACHRDDLDLLRRAMRDVVIAPQRLGSIPGGADALAAATFAGAIGASIAGSGPTLFAWVEGDAGVAPVRDAMVGAFAGHEVAVDSWCGEISRRGARVAGAGGR